MTAARQARVRKAATRLLTAGVAGQVFPGGTAAVLWHEDAREVAVLACGGRLSRDGAAVVESTPYDLSTLTQPFVATAALRLVAEGLVRFEDRADEVLSDVRGGVAAGITLEDILLHRSGLAPWGGLYLDVPHDPGTAAARRWILAEAARRASDEGQGHSVRSDLGYLIAGEMLVRSAGESLDRIVQSRVCEPLGISDEVFYAGALSADRKAPLMRKAAPTERCQWRGKLIQGEAHDENCAAMGGVAGHAGLFGTAAGVARLGLEYLGVLAGRSEFLSRDTITAALAESETRDPLRLVWRLAAGSASAGRRLGPRTFGMLGLTGTSVFCDPDRELVVALLTNRIHPSRANEKIQGFRPAFHDGIVAAFDA